MGKKVLLTTPLASMDDLWGQYSKGAGAYIPHGIASIAAFVRREGFQVEILDASALQTTEIEFKRYLEINRFNIIGIGNCYTALTPMVFHTADLSREVLPEAKIVIGGVHPTIFPLETLQRCPSADFVVFGEGELTFLEIVKGQDKKSLKPDDILGLAFRSADNRVIVNKPRPVIQDLDTLPQLPYEILPMKKYVPPPSNYKKLPTYGMLIQRGCPFKCIYCDSRIHGPKIRHMSVKKVIGEIKFLIQEYGMKGILFHDSIFTINRSWVLEFCKAIVEEKIRVAWTCYTRADCVDEELLMWMKKAGCWGVAYGIESANQESLDRIRKGINIEQIKDAVRLTKKAKLQVIASIILCLPGEDSGMVKNTIRFVKKLKLDTVVFFLPVPFPGTQLYTICKEEGGLVGNIEWADYRQWMDQTNPLYINPRIGKDNMLQLYDYAFRSFYLSPRTILRALGNINSWEDFRKYLVGFISIWGIIKRSFKKGVTNAS